MTLEEVFDPQTTGLTEKDAVYFARPIRITAKIERLDDQVIVKMHLDGLYLSFCSRCLCDIKQNWIQDFLFDFSIDRNTEYIEMDEDIRQEILLNLPGKILCQGDCKGICSKCGINLNEENCECIK